MSPILAVYKKVQIFLAVQQCLDTARKELSQFWGRTYPFSFVSVGEDFELEREKFEVRDMVREAITGEDLAYLESLEEKIDTRREKIRIGGKRKTRKLKQEEIFELEQERDLALEVWLRMNFGGEARVLNALFHIHDLEPRLDC